ncbi:MAG TPA: response regulator transcription factor [Dehalococcoidia bacterium]|nr:response regulator transcription factor [Dehalococcoidia bacterium]
MDKKILVVDDDPAFIRLTINTLTHSGYKVLTAREGQEALRLIFNHNPDLVLLDVMMPRMDGLQTCSRIRDVSDVPIVIITGEQKSEANIVCGLDHGADGYLFKPVGNKELVARVKATLRRAESIPRQRARKANYSDDFLTVDVAERKITVNGKRIRLTPTEFKLFAHLLGNAGRILTHKKLLENVWGWEYTDDIDHVRIYVWHLRQKIEPDPAHPKYIITEPGVGYYFQKSE